MFVLSKQEKIKCSKNSFIFFLVLSNKSGSFVKNIRHIIIKAEYLKQLKNPSVSLVLGNFLTLILKRYDSFKDLTKVMKFLLIFKLYIISIIFS